MNWMFKSNQIIYVKNNVYRRFNDFHNYYEHDANLNDKITHSHWFSIFENAFDNNLLKDNECKIYNDIDWQTND